MTADTDTPNRIDGYTFQQATDLERARRDVLDRKREIAAIAAAPGGIYLGAWPGRTGSRVGGRDRPAENAGVNAAMTALINGLNAEYDRLTAALRELGVETAG